MDDEDFLAAAEADTAPVEEPKVEPEAPVEPQEPTPEAVEPAPEPANPFTPPVVEAKPDPGFVPITAMLEEREKRQAEKARADALEARLAAQQQPAAIPDQWEDPEGYAAHQQSLRISDKLDISEEMARDKFGDEVVDQARDWALQQAQTRPGFYEELIRQRHPYKHAVELFKREQIASQVTPDDFAQFQAWKAAQAQLQAAPATAPATPNQPRTLPPRSLASAPSAGGVMTEVIPTEEEMFEAEFPKRT